jgi:endonuclease-3
MARPVHAKPVKPAKRAASKSSKPASTKPASTKLASAKPASAKPAAAKPTAKPSKADRGAREAERLAGICRGLDELYPDAHCELDFQTPFQLLVATILSAQCTDKRVNLVTPVLFGRFPDAAAMSTAEQAEVEEIVKSTGFFRNKAKNILGAARVLMEDFDGEVPRTMDELLTLPGVARKTANVVLGSAFGLNVGMVVDTHIARLSQRLALTRETDPVKIEQDLCGKLPQPTWTKVGHQLIWHGRRVCDARKPDCGGCAISPYCPSAGKV